jgi:ABC-type Zn uptake system ZnuABC Zn-binding protein ZnuA
MFGLSERTALSFLAVSAVSLLLFGIACGGGNGTSSTARKINVITTLPLLADFVREVGGDRVEVSSLIPPGVNPHTWQPSPGDAERIAAADIAFANGHDFEPPAIELIKKNLRQRIRLVEIATLGEKLEHVGGAEIFHDTIAGGHQPVLWMSVQNGKAYATLIRVELSTVDPEGEQAYKANAEKYLARVDETEKYAFHRLDDIPPENKKLISTDTSLEYFGSYYAIELTGQLSLYKGQELTAEDIGRIKERIREREALAVFVQPYSSPESEMLRQAGEEAGVAVCTLYSDSLDDKVTNYIDLIRFDADELYRCLGGQSGG